MSANIVPKAHIDALLRAGLTYDHRSGPLRWLWEPDQATEAGEYERGNYQGPRAVEVALRRWHELTPETASAVGQMLLAENYQSVNHRYNEESGAEPYEWDDALNVYGKLYSPVEILKAIDGYEYQACESPEWGASQAHAFCEALRRRVIGCLPGYDESSAWMITKCDLREGTERDPRRTP